jgi:hypothetical protein
MASVLSIFSRNLDSKKTYKHALCLMYASYNRNGRGKITLGFNDTRRHACSPRGSITLRCVGLDFLEQL